MKNPSRLNIYREAAHLIASSLKDTMGDSLVSVVLFGSTARGDIHENSDIDILIIAESLPPSRFERLNVFNKAEEKIRSKLRQMEREHGVYLDFSPVLKTPEEASRLVPLYLDLVEDAVILYDKDDFMKRTLDRLRRRLQELGAKRIWRGKRWYWILKPEIRPGEVIEIE